MKISIKFMALIEDAAWPDRPGTHNLNVFNLVSNSTLPFIFARVFSRFVGSRRAIRRQSLNRWGTRTKSLNFTVIRADFLLPWKCWLFNIRPTSRVAFCISLSRSHRMEIVKKRLFFRTLDYRTSIKTIINFVCRWSENETKGRLTTSRFIRTSPLPLYVNLFQIHFEKPIHPCEADGRGSSGRI